MNESCVVCGKKAVHQHHRKLRSQGGGDEPSNLISVCLEDHQAIHANSSESYARGLLVHSWADPSEVEMFAEDGRVVVEVEMSPVHGEPRKGYSFTREIPEGQPCPTCKRRVPHKKKPSTPKSRVFSTRVPLENSDSFSELVDAAAEHHGLTARPYHRYLCLLLGVTLLLQQPKGDLPVG